MGIEKRMIRHQLEDARLNDLIGSTYEAILLDRPDLLMQIVAREFNCRYVVFCSAQHGLVTKTSMGIPAQIWDRQKSFTPETNPMFALAVDEARRGSLRLGHIADRDWVMSTEFARQVLSPADIAHGMTTHALPGQFCIAMYRSSTDSEFNLSEEKRLKFLLKHIERAIELSERVVVLGINASVHNMRWQFSLTDREMQVATLLVKYLSIDLVSDYLGIGRETVRTHLKSVFSKTRTRNQAELTRLLLARRQLDQWPDIDPDTIQ